MSRAFAVTGLSLLMVGCAALTQTATTGNTATAELKNAGGQTVGTATFTEVGGGVRVVIEARGLPAGQKAVHLHTTGQCDPPAFTSAGDHLNPTGKQHGLLNPQGPHAGDLPNLTIAADGTGRLESFNDRITLTTGANSVLDADGTAIVVHVRPDDFKTDPSGNSGDRIACGVIVKPQSNQPGKTSGY